MGRRSVRLPRSPREGRSDGQASSADIETATGRIDELEVALRRAEEEAAAARNGPGSQEELDRVKRDADERVAEMERQMLEDAAKVDPEMEALRGQLADARGSGQGARGGVARTPEAIDLRARLAQAAARKRLGPSAG